MAFFKLLHPRNPHSIPFLLAFALFMTPFHFMAQGRQFPSERTLIGSRPPRCGERCRSCGKCEAVQVPIASSNGNRFLKHGVPTNRVEYSRGDDLSNYKPMCWKCKCGDIFLNP